MTMLADFVLMGHENVGSFALSSDKTALFAVALGGWLDGIRDIFNLHAIPRLVAINGWPTDRCWSTATSRPRTSRLSATTSVSSGAPAWSCSQTTRWRTTC
jgi:hypothetical protein